MNMKVLAPHFLFLGCMKRYDKSFEGASASFLILGPVVVVRGGRLPGSPASTQVAFNQSSSQRMDGWVGDMFIRVNFKKLGPRWCASGVARSKFNFVSAFFWIL